ncbi:MULTISPECIES: PilZ domain-containing protein [Geobacter]|uniref:Pilus assembly protein PilZ n=2 Tax=Geobacter TaxID=28231 RepID=A0A0C1U590_9BACT|nr:MULTISPECIES: PilZ domain-containing protein [Geobacter]ANA40804.1 pilus assembly protein PilZ [Geobacter anodireducens]KIE42885.1 pilus assembly protein PilZ [Geobacter soli]MBE2889417.1 PilZ domain-containing protein [Geobacter anodireducens]HMN03733.1 PilZ domain-containing protein [Geobacter anodireducens]
MAEKRKAGRVKRRLSLRFGTDTPSRLAFTEDVSARGLFVKTTNLCPPGTLIQIELELPDGDPVFLEGMVRWSKKVPPQVIHLVRKSGMGVRIIRFIAGEERYRRFVDGLRRTP